MCQGDYSIGRRPLEGATTKVSHNWTDLRESLAIDTKTQLFLEILHHEPIQPKARLRNCLLKLQAAKCEREECRFISVDATVRFLISTNITHLVDESLALVGSTLGEQLHPKLSTAICDKPQETTPRLNTWEWLQ